MKKLEEFLEWGGTKKDITCLVLPGETIAVDGVILSGQTSINQAVMTGESTVFWFDFGYHQFCISVCKASATMLS